MSKNEEKKIKDLQDLLSEERSALLRGDLQKIVDILEEKSVILGRFEDLKPTDVFNAPKLRETVLRNQVLLDEALKGIRSVVDRVSELQRVRNNLDTYDKTGKRQSIQSHAPSFEKRA